MTGGRWVPQLRGPAVGPQPALVLRPWRAADIPPLAAEMSREYPVGGMWPGPGERPGRTALPGGTQLRAGPVGERKTAEIGYWTAVAARGRGIAPAAVRAVTDWVFDAFAGAGLRQIMLVHDVGNPGSCRVAAKAGYPFLELSPAHPPHWLTHGRIHMRQISLI